MYVLSGFTIEIAQENLSLISLFFCCFCVLCSSTLVVACLWAGKFLRFCIVVEVPFTVFPLQFLVFSNSFVVYLFWHLNDNILSQGLNTYLNHHSFLSFISEILRMWVFYVYYHPMVSETHLDAELTNVCLQTLLGAFGHIIFFNLTYITTPLVDTLIFFYICFLIDFFKTIKSPLPSWRYRRHGWDKTIAKKVEKKTSDVVVENNLIYTVIILTFNLNL